VQIGGFPDRISAARVAASLQADTRIAALILRTGPQ
jgi:hypothetical protein